MGNYRPIALLESMCKIIVALIMEPIGVGLGSWLWPTQYGVRRNQSTSLAIYVARRLLDIAERQ